MARRGSYANVSKLRKTLRRIEPELRKEVEDEVEHAAQVVQADAIKLAPKDTGNLASQISYKVARDGLTAKIGFRGKKANRQAFYARFIEFGTKKTAPRLFKKGARKGKTKRGHSGLPARPFLQPALQNNFHYITYVS